MEQTTLYYRHGSSDKVYQASTQAADGGFIVQFAFGRRGTTLQTGTKTQSPVPYEKAKAIFDKLIAEKLAKGYTPGENGTPYQHTGRGAQVTGILPQLLNPIEEAEVNRLIADPRYWLQEKYDGQRLLIQKANEEVNGINRRGLRVALPDTLADDAMALPLDCLLDGEAIGEQFHVFDLLRFDGEDLRSKPYLERYLGLMRLASAWECKQIRLVPSACVDQEKSKMFQELRANEREGVVFKKIDEPYTAGRPASGGPALKFKFQETASFVVSRINDKRSVSLVLFDDGVARPAGNVTIPPNHAVPDLGAVVECRFLYALRESGSIYQPVYLGRREDIPPEECMVSQLKFKPESKEQPA